MPNFPTDPQLFWQALALGVLGAVALWLKDLPRILFGWLKQFFIVTLSFDSRDEFMFMTLVDYMNELPVLRAINNFTVRAVRSTSDYTSLEEELRQGGHPQAYLSPGEGFHLFKLQGHWLWMKREVQVSTTVVERISLSTFGRHKALLERFVEAALTARTAREVNKVPVFIPSPYTGGDWMRTRLGNSRKLASVVLKAGQSNDILDDLKRFFASQGRYIDLGIPWRRGYLLYGAPGTGKTSLVTALASELCLNVCSLSLASSNISDEKIHTLLAAVPPRSILLIEDVDAFFRQREQATQQVKISFSGFLNALDGVATHEGSVLFMTTNHPELLDEALIRAGRIDFRMELSPCDRHQLYHMFLKFFPDTQLARRFADTLPEGRISPAQVQERLLNLTRAEDALDALSHSTPPPDSTP